MKKIKIGLMFPDTLYLHGERGNILALLEILKWYDKEGELVKINFDNIEKTDFMDFDILFIAPGDLSAIELVKDTLWERKDELDKYINEGRLLIVTGTSIALFGKGVKRTDGTSYKGLGLIDVSTIEKGMVYGDDIYYKVLNSDFEIIGNQIQVADFISGDVDNFAEIIYGYGNTGKDKREGFIKKNAIFTNALGPMLAVNMEYTMNLLKDVLSIDEDAKVNKDLLDIDKVSFDIKKDFILSKETKLNNA